MEVNGVNNVNMKGNAAAHNEVNAKEVAQVSGASAKDIKAAHEAQASYGKADVAFCAKKPSKKGFNKAGKELKKYVKPETEVDKEPFPEEKIMTDSNNTNPTGNTDIYPEYPPVDPDAEAQKTHFNPWE